MCRVLSGPFILGDKAVAAARASNLPKRILKRLDEAHTTRKGLACVCSSRTQRIYLRSENSRGSSWRTDNPPAQGKQLPFTTRQ